MVEGTLNSMGDNEATLERRRREASGERKDDPENPPSRTRAYGDEDDVEVSGMRMLKSTNQKRL
eukprot:767912-Hanusia_phi.AAC.2